ncbi:ribosomal protein L30 [Chloropicon roscoffensis]|uniref:Ribosomal protein L30 n=1 Tax=Chloropicon roscoffensis TaxID=1461544 RepID=A0AAX4PE39_9CHLO
MAGGTGAQAGKLAQHLVVKLMRGTAGKQKLHLATLKTLKLNKAGRQVVVPNTLSVRFTHRFLSEKSQILEVSEFYGFRNLWVNPFVVRLNCNRDPMKYSV